MCYHSNSCRSIIISSKRWERVDGKSFSSLSAAQFRAQDHQSVKLKHQKEKNLCAPKWWKLKPEQLQGWSTEGSKDNNVFPSFIYFVLSLIRGSHMVRITTLQGATWTPHILLSCLHGPQDDTEITLGRSLEPQTGQKASLSSPIKASHVTLDDPIDSKVETGGLTSWMWLWDTLYAHLLSVLAADVNNLIGRLDKVRQVTDTHIDAECVDAWWSIVGKSIGRALISSNGEHQSERSV